LILNLLRLYKECFHFGRCKYNGKHWTINEIEKLSYTITTASGSRGDRSYPFGLIDEEFEALRGKLLEFVTSNKVLAARMVGNSEDPSFKDKIIPLQILEIVVICFVVYSSLCVTLMKTFGFTLLENCLITTWIAFLKTFHCPTALVFVATPVNAGRLSVSIQITITPP
jgi:hypothetical protein